MGFPRIIYGANLDQIVDFEEYPREGSGVSKVTKIFEEEADSGKEKSYFFFSKRILNLVFKCIPPHGKAQLEAFRDYAEDGSTFTVEMDRNLGAEWNFEGQSLKNNDGTDGTFSRSHVANAASYINPATGLLTFVNTANTARFPDGKFGSGAILVEDTRTNLLGRSLSLDTSPWATTAATCVSTTDVLDPAGGTDAFKITTSAGSYANGINYATSTAVSTDDAVFSVWVRTGYTTADATVNVRLGITGTTGGGNTNIEVATDKWQRFQVEVDNTVDAPTGNWNVALSVENSGEIIYAAFAQLEVGADIKGASAYIESDAGSTVTRAAETVQWAAANIVDPLEGTVMFWVKPEWTYLLHPDACLFSIDRSPSGVLIDLYVLSTGNFRLRYYYADGSTVSTITTTANGYLTQNDWSHIAFTWKSNTELALYANGTQLDTNTITFSPARLGTNIDLGHGAGSDISCAAFSHVKILKTALNSTIINRIANQGEDSYFGRNRMTCRLVNKDFQIVPRFGGVSESTVSAKEVV